MQSVVVDEDSVHCGDDTSEEDNTGAAEDPSNNEKTQQDTGGTSLGSSLVESLKSTVKSATGFITPASLGGPADEVKVEAEGEPPSVSVSDVGIDSDVVEEAPATKDDPSRADENVAEESSPEDTVTDVSADGWSVVDPFPEEAAEDQTQFESQSTSVEGEGLRAGETKGEKGGDGTHELGDPNSSVEEAQSSPSSISAEPETQEEESHTATSPSGSDTPSVPLSYLRRRPRSSFSKERRDDDEDDDAHSFRFPDTGDLSAMAEWAAAFEPKYGPFPAPSRDTELGEKELQNEDRENSPSKFRFPDTGDLSAMAEWAGAFEPRYHPLPAASRDTEVGGRELQNEDRENSPSKGDDDEIHSTPTKELEVRPNDIPELEGGDDGDASSISSREPDAALGVVEKWAPPSRSQLEEGWEDIGSSSDLEGTASPPPPIPPIPPEARPLRRKVYRMPSSDGAEGDDGDDNRSGGTETPTQLLVQPAGFIVRAVEFQLNLIVHVIAVGIWLFNFTLSTISHPVSRTVAVKERVTSATTGAASQVGELFAFVGDGVAQAGPAVSKLSKRTFWCCLSAAYVLCVLGLLLIPALFVNVAIVNTMVEDPVVIRQALDFDFTQPKPVAALPLFSAKEMERIQSLPPDKVVKTRVIPLGNRFRVSVVLTLPESDYNMNLGMFQVTAELLSARGEVLMRASKPCRLRFKSFPVQLVKTLIYAVPHLVGLSKEAQTIEVRLLEAREKATATASVRIFVEPKAGFPNGGGVPEIYEAAARLESTLPWPRGLLSSWKWVFFVWNGVCVFIFEVSAVLCCCRQVIVPRFGRKAVAAEDEIAVGKVKEEERAARGEVVASGSGRRAWSNRRVYFEDGIPGAAGAHERKGSTRRHSNHERADGAERIGKGRSTN